ncbi:MAG: RecQ family zinc-binding domain-containing protein, partial [Bdellovibrionota bacterium]
GSIEGRQARDWKPVSSPPEEYLDQKLFDARMKGQSRKLFEVVEFAKLTEGCRMSVVSAYFGFTGASACGVCDLCRKATDGEA